MHFIISLCLCILFLAIKCAETSYGGAARIITFEGKENAEIAEIRNNGPLKTIYVLGERLVETIGNLSSVESVILCRIRKKLSISINELSINTNEKSHNGHKLTDIVNEIKERSLVNTLESFRKNIEEMKSNFKNYHVDFSDRNEKSLRMLILLSRNELSKLIDGLKAMEIVTWYLHVQWVDTPSDADVNERKNVLETIALVDLEWRENWDDLLNEIHKLSHTTSSGYDGIVPLSNDIFKKFDGMLINFYWLLYWFHTRINKTTIKAATSSNSDKNIFDQIFRILESLCTENKYVNTSIRVKIRNPTNKPTNSTLSTDNVGKLNSHTDAQSINTSNQVEAREFPSNFNTSLTGDVNKPDSINDVEFINTSNQIEVREFQNSSNVGTLLINDMGKPANPTSAHPKEQKQVKKTWFEENKGWILWSLSITGVVLVMVLFMVIFFLYKKQGN